MKTEYLINYSFNTVREFYAQGLISQCQYEAYLWIWNNDNTKLTANPTPFESEFEDAKIEIYKLLNALGWKIDNGKVIHKPYV